MADADALFIARASALRRERRRLQIELLKAKLRELRDGGDAQIALQLSHLCASQGVQVVEEEENGRIVTAADALAPSTAANCQRDGGCETCMGRALPELASAAPTLGARVCLRDTESLQLGSSSSGLQPHPAPEIEPVMSALQGTYANHPFQKRTYYPGMTRQRELRAPTAPWHPFRPSSVLINPNRPQWGYGYSSYRVPAARFFVDPSGRVSTRLDSLPGLNITTTPNLYSDRPQVLGASSINTAPVFGGAASNFGFQKQTNYPFRLTYQQPRTTQGEVHRSVVYTHQLDDPFDFPMLPSEQLFDVGEDGRLVPK